MKKDELKTIENLKLLKEGIKDIPPENFHMEFFRTNSKNKPYHFFDKTKCGTFGCLLGNAPLIKGLEAKNSDRDWSGRVDPDKWIRKHGKVPVCFEVYGKRVFPALYGSSKHPSRNLNWYWLFDAGWVREQNSIEDAIWRIDQVLEIGLDFFNWSSNWYFEKRHIVEAAIKDTILKLNKEKEK